VGRQPPAFLVDPRLRLLLFGGKGGVGKTTAAAATALYRAACQPECSILLASTDPAHSLSDSVGQPIGDDTTPVAGIPNLVALEMDAGRRFEAYERRHADVFRTIAERGTFFDSGDIAQFLDLSLPGLDELMAVLEIADIVRQGRYDLVILDTAPTGHTLRLLALPKLMDEWLRVLDLMLEKHRYMASVFARYRPDETDAFLERMSDDLVHLRALLRDNTRTEFVPVTIPEVMSIAETARLLESLEAMRVRVRTVIVNRVVAGQEDAFSESRREAQRRHLEEIERRFGNSTPGRRHLVRVPLFPGEVQGREALIAYARAMLGEGPCVERLSPQPAATRQSATTERGGAAAAPLMAAMAARQLLLVGGKGGVGKTTVATATAIHLARTHPDTKTLLFSTDPAHSLSDSLDQAIGDRITPVAGVDGLYAYEMEAFELLEELKRTYVAEINEVFDAFLSGPFDAPLDRKVMEALVSVTPPGIDELMALMKVMDLMDEGAFDRYVLDMAPTGHALRFLEMPEMVRQWFIAFFRLLIKYQGIVSLSRVATLLREKSKQLRQVQRLLTDSERCEFVAVVIPEAMAVSETRRLLGRLAEISVTCRWVVVNMVVPLTDSTFWAATRAEQQRHLRELDGLAGRMVPLPLFGREIRGVGALTMVANALYGEDHG